MQYKEHTMVPVAVERTLLFPTVSNTNSNTQLFMGDHSAATVFSLGDKVTVIEDVVKSGKNLKGLSGSVIHTWEKCDVDPTCCCAEMVDENLAVHVRFDVDDNADDSEEAGGNGLFDNDTFIYYFAESELVVKKQEEDTITSVSVGGRVLPTEYYKSVYDEEQEVQPSGLDPTIGAATTSTDAATTPWDIGGGKPQPSIVKAYEEGKLRGRILDVGCGAGENCIYLAQKYGVTSIVGCDIAPGAIRMAQERVRQIMEPTTTITRSQQQEDSDASSSLPTFWTRPEFFVASCTEIVDTYQCLDDEANDHEANEKELFDVTIDSGLLHCLSDDVAKVYVQNLAQLVKPSTGRVYVGCFSTKNPAESWDNPRRLSPEYLEQLFCTDHGWEVISIVDTWWSRPPGRGSSQGAFSMALWMEARRIAC
jgi:SAM-dependent methyltransferase